MYSENGRLYEFEGFTLNSGSETLWRKGELVAISPKAIKLLLLLIERGGELVTKQEIFDSVWGDAFVADGVLTQNIYTLRNQLGTDAEGRQLIETVPRRGYRFSGRVTSRSAAAQSHEFIPTNSPAASTAQRLPIAAYPTPSNRVLAGKRLIVSAIAVAIIAAGAAGVYLWTSRNNIAADAPMGVIAAPIEKLRLQPITDSGDVVYPTISPNGELLAYVRHGETDTSVWIRQIATGSSVQILPPSEKGYRSLAFTSDGAYVYFREQEETGPLYVVPVLGGSPRKVLSSVSGDFSVSPDGTAIAFVRSDHSRSVDSLVVSALDGSAEREVVSRVSAEGLRGLPAWSPDGKRIAVGVISPGGNYLTPAAFDVMDGSGSTLGSRQWRNISAILWMPEGDSLVFSARAVDESKPQLWILSLADGSVRRLTNDLEGYFWLSRSADGKLLVTRQQRIDARLWLAPDGDAAGATPLTHGERSLDGYFGLDVGPDGSVVYTVRSGEANDLFSITKENSGPVRLASGSENRHPQATSDGRYIIFSSDRSGSMQIWRIDVHGGAQQQLTFDPGGKVTCDWPAVSRDASYVYFIRRTAGNAGVWKVPVEGGEPVSAYDDPRSAVSGPLAVSPGGKWLAAGTSAEASGTASRLAVISLDGTAETKYFDVQMRRPVVRWISDTVFDYTSGTADASLIMRQNINGGDPTKISEFPDRIYNFEWSPDGLVVSRGSLRGDAILITNLR